MNTLKKLGTVALASVFLTACGDKENNASNKTTASASSTSSISKYDEILNALPEVDQALAAPIAISDKKSQTATNELDKAFSIFESPEATKIERLGFEINNLGNQTTITKSQVKEVETKMLEVSAKLATATDKYKQLITSQNFQDPEIKAIMDRTVTVYDTLYKMMKVIAENQETILNSKSTDFDKELELRIERISENIGAGNKAIEDAIVKIADKYAVN
ncbi:putative lipoprotein [Haemophilus sputorum HK 2154]|nr:hypothetical protein [Haemophilus sputorum]EJP30532.1 putative lipoprotein [Haemophilus sputorum HK 2154]